jgi:hypothetical protein
VQPGEIEWSGCVDETGAMLLCGRVERVWLEGGRIGRSNVVWWWAYSGGNGWEKAEGGILGAPGTNALHKGF